MLLGRDVGSLRGRLRSDPKLKSACAWAAAMIVGCGSNGGSSGGFEASNQTSCPPGDVYCGACDGGGFCSNACPEIVCLANANDGGARDGGAVADGGTCPARAASACLDCNGGNFCVTGNCPATTCPAADAGADARSDSSRIPIDAASHCCIPLSCEGLNCECGSCPISVCGMGTMDCGGCEGGEVCQADRCVGSAEASTDAGVRTCTPTTCPASDICIQSQVSGGAIIVTNDAGICPAGTEPAPGSLGRCNNDPTIHCAARPASCGSTVTCACASGLCGSGPWMCNDSAGASFLSSVEEVP
jgi:hypothetical protein